MIPPPPSSTLFPYTTLFRSAPARPDRGAVSRSRHLRRGDGGEARHGARKRPDRKSTRLNSSHVRISYAVFCLKKKKIIYLTNHTSVSLIILPPQLSGSVSAC